MPPRPSLELFAGLFARGEAASQLSDEAWLQAMLDVEAGLARALSRAGLIEPHNAKAIATVARADRFDVAALGRAAAQSTTPVPALVRALRKQLDAEAAEAVHRGATSQDIIDSAMMLVAKRTLAPLLCDLEGAGAAAARLVEAHRRTLMLARTLLQPAVPTTFGLKAAGWLHAIDDSRARLGAVATERLQVQFGGAAGTLASLDDRGLEISRLLSEELGLREPLLPWHTNRLPVLELGGALGGVAAALGKIARDVTLLAQAEVAEVSERAQEGRGGSTAMPHKQNPVGAVAVLACTRRVPGLLATLFAAGEQEHERASGAWQSEWEALTDLLRLTASAAVAMNEVLGGLVVDHDRMRENLDNAGGLPMSENLKERLADALGYRAAERFVQHAAAEARRSRRSLFEVLFSDAEFSDVLRDAGFSHETIRAALEPASSLGSAADLIERVLSAHSHGGSKKR